MNQVNVYCQKPTSKIAATSKQICYTLPGSSEVCVTGDSYEIIEPSFRGGQAPLKPYNIYASMKGVSIDPLVPNSTFTVLLNPSNANFFGPINSVGPWSPNGSPDFTVFINWYVWSFWVNCSVVAGKPPGFEAYNFGNWRFWTDPYDVYCVRVDGTSKENDILQYGTNPTTLKIKNASGSVIATLSSNGTPTVRIMDGASSSTCTYGEWFLSHQISLNPTERLEIQKTIIGGLKSTRIIKHSSDSRNPRGEIIYSDSASCNYPLVKIENTNKKEECPPNSCEVICSGHRCCYDALGRVVKQLDN